MSHQFVQYLSNFVQLDQKEMDVISSQVPVKEYKAGAVLLKEGKIATLSFFNIKGCVRMYYLIDGEEKTTFFYTENQFITSMRSFTTSTPADHYLECVEDCTLALIPNEVEKELLANFPKLETFARIILEKELANYQEMLANYITSNPEQRYRKLLQQNPDLLQRVPLYQLASYIGVKAESLSRIRSRISKQPS
jgi:CRP-like cAMP-binding protein